MSTPRTTPKADKAFLVKLTTEQHAAFREAADEAGLTMQAYAELRIFGEIRPRGINGPRPRTKRGDQEVLPLTG